MPRDPFYNTASWKRLRKTKLARDPFIDLIAPNGHTVAPYTYDASSNGKYEAIYSRPQPRVREDDCVGCRLCYNVCPEDCIEMVEFPSSGESVTWDELSKARPEVTEDWEAMRRYRDERGIHID